MLCAVAGADDASRPARVERRWLIGDLHVHVSPPDADKHSSFTVASAIDAARKLALDFVVLTPHDAQKSFASTRGADAPPVCGQELAAQLAAAVLAPVKDEPAPRPIVVVSGWEFTRETPGHLGVSFFKMGDVANVPDDEKAGRALSKGALVVVNHPFFRPVKSDLPIMKMLTGDRGWRPFLGEAHDDLQWNAIEVWHERSVLVQRLHANCAVKFPDTQMVADSLKAWDKATSEQRRRIVGVGGSDCHGKPPYAVSPMAMLSVSVASFDENGLREGLLACHVTFGRDGGTAARDLTATSDVPGEAASIGDSLRAKSQVRLAWSGRAVLVENGERVGEFDGGATRRIEPPGAFRFWRIEKPLDAYSNCVYANLP